MPTEISHFSADDDLPQKIYVDSNIIIAFLYLEHDHHDSASLFLLEAIAQKRMLLISAQTLDEVWYVLMQLWHRAATSNKFKGTPNQVALYSAKIREMTTGLLQLDGISLVYVSDPVDIAMLALDAIDCRLAPRDSFHVAYAVHGSSNSVATIDSDFEVLVGCNFPVNILKLPIQI